MMKRRAIKQSIQAMKYATHYQEWADAAKRLDQLEGHDDWKADPASPHYSYQLLQDRLKVLQRHRLAGEDSKLLYHLREGLHRRLGNLHNPMLYDVCYAGTKYLIEEYTQEVVTSLKYLCHNANLPLEEKIRFFKQTGQSFGRSALLLSGGATFGVFHLGVVRALWEQNLMPRVISGSSAGSILTAVLGCSTDSQVEDILENPCEAYFHPWERLGLQDMWQQGSLMNNQQLEQFIRYNVGEDTLEEAFLRTKRIINITISPVDKNHTPRLVNYLTFPHLYTWSVALASCSVPYLFQPVTLKAKNQHGAEASYLDEVRWKDGTLTNDLPMHRLSELYNVNHCIVSQTNPHVLPFLNHSAPTSGWMAFSKRMVQSELRHRTKQLVRFLDQSMAPGLITQMAQEAHTLINQDYYGDITLSPSFSLLQYSKVLSNPTKQEMKDFILAGERAAWPQISKIRNQIQISQTFENCLIQLKQQRRKKKVD